MGKFLVGCFAVVGVLVVAAAAAGYFFFVKPAMDFGQEAVRIGKEFQQLEEQVENKDPYTPPDDGRVSPAQLERLLAAQRDVREALEGNLAALQRKYEELENELEAEDREASLRELSQAYQDLGDLLLDARRAQVAALNQHGFSPQEYAWVRAAVYRTIGETVAVGMGQFLSRGEMPPAGEVHEDTAELVAPHRDELLESHPLAWWGF